MSTIKQIIAREILDARGLPTIECTLLLDNGQSVMTAVPSGTSTGKYEAKELRDKDVTHMLGKGVTQAVNNINTVLAPELIGKDPTNQTDLDQLMVNLDGTKDKTKLGANAILACSQAILKAGAVASGLPLFKYIQQKYQLTEQFLIPTCIFSMIEGGKHGAENLDIQEFEIIPASHVDYPSAINMAVIIYQKIKEVLMMKGAIHSTGLNGGFTPNLFNNTDAFEIIIESIKATPYTFAQDVFLGADMSAATFHEAGKYSLKDKSQALSSKELAKYYKTLKDLYHVFYIEDPFQEDDEAAWKEFTADIGTSGMVVADKLLVTSLERTTRAINEKLCNSITVKPNQTGTVSETIQVIKLAKESGWQVICSHRSGETNDDFIADLAVGTGVQYVKFGPPNRGERIAKYNRLLAIADLISHPENTTITNTVITPETTEVPENTEVAEVAEATEVAEVTEAANPPTATEVPEATITPEVAAPDNLSMTQVETPAPTESLTPLTVEPASLSNLDMIDPNAPLSQVNVPVADPNVLNALTTPTTIIPMPELTRSISAVPDDQTASNVPTLVVPSETQPITINSNGEVEEIAIKDAQ